MYLKIPNKFGRKYGEFNMTNMILDRAIDYNINSILDQFQDTEFNESVLGVEDLKKSLEKSRLTNESIHSLWGISPNAPIHLGYDKLLLNQKKLLSAGFEHTIILADIHLKLAKQNDNDLTSIKSQYYHAYFKDLIGLDNVNYVFGSSFQFTEEYTKLLHNAFVQSNLSDVSKTVPTFENNKISDLVQSLMQIVDLIYFKAQIAFGDSGQLRVYSLARKILPKIGFKKPIVLSAKLGHDLMGNELSQSTSKTRICIHESQSSIAKKIKKTYAPIQQVSDNPLIELCKYSVWPWIKEKPVSINLRPEGQAIISSFDELCDLYEKDIIGPQELKQFVTYHLWNRISTYQSYYQNKPELVEWINMNKINN